MRVGLGVRGDRLATAVLQPLHNLVVQSSDLISCVDSVAEELAELREAEKASGRKPDPAIDALLKAQTIVGKRESIVTEYLLKLLGLDVSLIITISHITHLAVIHP